MITIYKRKLAKTTLYSVWKPNYVPTFIEHKNCIISTKEGYMGGDRWKHVVTITDDTNEIVYQTACDTLPPLDVIKAEVLFYDKEDALKYYKESLAKEEKDCKKEIKSITKRLKKATERLETIQKLKKDI